MEPDRTERQSPEGRRKSADLSLRRTHPPAQVPGYRIDEFLGSGAYGEVWVGVDQNTGRRVAIKFYTHRGSVDWSLLSREVEKLVYLSADRYVVQLLDVGWDADPPYYVMDFIENGSLNDRLERDGPMTVEQASELFREVAVGLVHAHDKGILHCDLKPANVLLDQDDKPRLADFGQSRLTHEQTPSLGTLFFMAPEQADLDAVPDAQWDVYALGALVYTAAVGEPPYRSEETLQRIDDADSLTERLHCYRDLIRSASRPTQHRALPGMDKGLAEIIDRCLAPSPADRFNNVQEVLSALRQRDRRRNRQPQLILGLIGPLLILLIMSILSWRIYDQAVTRSTSNAVARARETNAYAAEAIANRAARDIQRYFNAVETVSRDGAFQDQLVQFVSANEALLKQLADPNLNGTALETRETLIARSKDSAIQRFMDQLLHDPENDLPEVASWFVTDRRGTQLASSFASAATNTVGRNYSWRTYFHGGPDDLLTRVDGQRVYGEPEGHLKATSLSAPFQSTATNRWKIAISTPIFRETETREFVGVVALTVDLGGFMVPESSEASPTFFAALIDGREGSTEGMILQHPMFNDRDVLPDSYSQHRVSLDAPNGFYRDPLGKEPGGDPYDRLWIVAQAPVRLAADSAGYRTGLTVIVQEDHEAIIAPVSDLGDQLMREGLIALLVFLLVVVGLWAYVSRVMGEATTVAGNGSQPRTTTSNPLYDRTTMAAQDAPASPADADTEH